MLNGARPFVHLYPSKTFSLHLFGVKFDFNSEHEASNHGNSFDGETETMSRNSRVRLLKKTSALEFLGERPTHMLTLTLPPEKFEMLADTEKVSTWKYAKSFFLRKLSKALERDEKALWFQEFQERGAPHLHVFLDIGKLNDTEWKEYLNRFITIWKKALKWDESKEFPTQSVDFARLRKPDFRYARKYASKLKQKDAPFVGKWGKWWGTTGEWRVIKEGKELDVELPTEIQSGVFTIRENMNWIAWDKIKALNEPLYDKIVLELRKKRVNTEEKWTLRRAKRITLDMKVSMLCEERKRRERGEKTMEEIEEEKRYQRRKEASKIRYDAYLKQKAMPAKNKKVARVSKWTEWNKMYPIERFLDMENADIEAFFDNVVNAEKETQKSLTLL